MSLAEVTGLLRCPHCRGDLSLDGRVLGCGRGHRFDIARQGHVNLLGHAAGANADTAEMVAARVRFLDAGHYAPIADRLARASGPGPILDAGAGTGYYLRTVLAAHPETVGLATDISAYACRRAATVARAGAVVADTWSGLPVHDGSIGTILAVFAPRNLGEFARIAASGGRLVVVTPTAGHLAELRAEGDLIGIEPGKRDRLMAAAEPGFRHADGDTLEYALELSPEQAGDLVAMGPNAFHGVPEYGRARTVTVSVHIDTFVRRDA